MQPEERAGRTPLRGRDLIVLLDVSHSMLAEDVAPNRLAQAKTAARSLALAVQRDGGHRLGLLTFAGRADDAVPAHARLRAVPQAAGGRHHRRGRPARDLDRRGGAPGHAGVRRAHSAIPISC